MNLLVKVVHCCIISLVLCDTLQYRPSQLQGNCNSTDENVCPTSETCCVMKNGNPTCCHFQRATCCEDFLHCCPEGYTCDNEKGICINGESTLRSERTKVVRKKQKHYSSDQVQDIKRRLFGSSRRKERSHGIMCPDKRSECADGNTCCKMDDGQWGCCPYRDAVCCPDGNICCPSGYKCNCNKKMCYNETQPTEVPMVTKHHAILIDGSKTEHAPASVSCGDGSVCGTGSTCCQRYDGSYSCCPVDGICCDDGKHCCPSGSTCDASSGACHRGGLSSDWLFHGRFIAKKRTNSIMCPDHHSMCPDGCTCCLRTDMSWGCCPMPQAVCCSDHIHCCPHNYKCDLVHMICTSHWSSQSWTPLKSSVPSANIQKPHRLL